MTRMIIYILCFAWHSLSVSAFVERLATRSVQAMIPSAPLSVVQVVEDAVAEPVVPPTDSSLRIEQTGTTIEPSNRRPVINSLSTWRRRLDTKQDPFDIHKWAGFGWWISSTLIFGIGAFSGFTHLPDMLEYVTYLFLLSTAVQSASAIPMALQYRKNDPVQKRGFIASAITSISLAFTGFWLSPFANDSIDPIFAAALIVVLVLADSIYSLTQFEEIKILLAEKIKEIDPTKRAQAVKEKITTIIPLVPIGLPMNAFLLQQMLAHAENVRDYFLTVIENRGSSAELVYYASVVSSIAICVGNLAATLRHRKLISKDMENVATIGSVVVTLAFNIRAAGTF